MYYENKFHLNREQNIFLAKKIIVQNIYNSAKLEGVNVTFPETQTILDGTNIPSLALSDVEKILNLRDGWKYLFRSMDKDVDVELISKINFYISRNESLDWGVLRYGDISISGTNYKPPVPDEEQVNSKLNEIYKMTTATDRALEYFVWGIKSQLFWDGNKRTSTLVANRILIEGGAGILTIPEDRILEFNIKLSDFYNNNTKDELKGFLYENCIEGMVIRQEKDDWDMEV